MADNICPALVVPENFIQATRDSGYKTLGSALAELLDNSFEANARKVDISIGKTGGPSAELKIIVSDDGHGMNPHTIRQSLRFGWSSRFNSRSSFGRYGMGLPNASLSHARRVEVWSSESGKSVCGSSLDVDAVGSNYFPIPDIHNIPHLALERLSRTKKGTVVIWSRCDRLINRSLGPVCKRLRRELGRLFRYQLWAGKQITLNDEILAPFDPLFLRPGLNLLGANAFGPDLIYEVNLPEGEKSKSSTVRVRFTELPIHKWHSLSNVEKNQQGIAKNAGVSIIRAGREIDRGWFFMGQKRKENYDDWWRCEVTFEPVLDELFGVTHTKQDVHPTDYLLSILVPDIERTARELNVRARKAFVDLKSDASTRVSEKAAERSDNLLEPPAGAEMEAVRVRELKRGSRGRVGGLEYRFKFESLDDSCLYVPLLEENRITVTLNESHPLISSMFSSSSPSINDLSALRRNLELLILAAARSELIVGQQQKAKSWIQQFRQAWSQTLATFLG